MDKLLHSIWYDPQTGFVSAKLLLQRAKEKHPDEKFTQSKVDEWLAKQRTAQLHKQNKVKKTSGHITAQGVNSRWQADLVDMTRYAAKNSSGKNSSEFLDLGKSLWILICVDVFTRKLYARSIPTKEVKNVANAFQDIVKEAGESPLNLDTDQGSEFSKTFDTLVGDMVHRRAKIGDHRALGVVDSTIRTFKNLIFRTITQDENSKRPLSWAKNLQLLVNNFNSSPKSALNDHTPLEVEKSEVLQAVIGTINGQKLQKTLEKKENAPEFTVGEKIRVPVEGKFKRGFKKQQSDKSYPITKVNANSVEVTVEGKLKRYLFSEINATGVPLDEDTFEVEKIFDQTRNIKRGKKTVKQVLLKFKDDDEPQWVDQSDIFT